MPLDKNFHLFPTSESESEEEPMEEPPVSLKLKFQKKKDVPIARGKRNSKAPTRFRENFIQTLSNHEILAGDVKVMVKCSQVGDRFVKRVAELSTPDDEPLTKNDLKCGTSLVADVDGCPYPVEVIGTVDEFKKKVKDVPVELKDKVKKKCQQTTMERKRKILSAACNENKPENSESKKLKLAQEEEEHEVSEFDDMENHPPKMAANFHSLSTKGNTATGNFQVPFTKTDHDMLLEMHSMLRKILRKQAVEGTSRERVSEACKLEGSQDQEDKFMVKGVNLLSLRARDVYQYALTLMDNLFDKEEMSVSLVKKTNRSEKPALDEKRVKLIEDCLERKFGAGYDRKGVITKMNQKCHDSKKGLTK